MPNPILKHFAYHHLPPHLQDVSKPLGDLARLMESTLPDCAEKSAGLRKLLEAKDCFVRAALDSSPRQLDPDANTRRASLADINMIRAMGGVLINDPAAPEGYDLGDDFWAKALRRDPDKQG